MVELRIYVKNTRPCANPTHLFPTLHPATWSRVLPGAITHAESQLLFCLDNTVGGHLDQYNTTC